MCGNQLEDVKGLLIGWALLIVGGLLIIVAGIGAHMWAFEKYHDYLHSKDIPVIEVQEPKVMYDSTTGTWKESDE